MLQSRGSQTVGHDLVTKQQEIGEQYRIVEDACKAIECEVRGGGRRRQEVMVTFGSMN